MIDVMSLLSLGFARRHCGAKCEIETPLHRIYQWRMPGFCLRRVFVYHRHHWDSYYFVLLQLSLRPTGSSCFYCYYLPTVSPQVLVTPVVMVCRISESGRIFSNITIQYWEARIGLDGSWRVLVSSVSTFWCWYARGRGDIARQHQCCIIT
jgi:hypothetical protein